MDIKNRKEIDMDDKQIVDLFWERSEDAINQAAKQYGRYCYSIAYGILGNKEDAEECVNDTYLKAWECIPPQRPNALSVFLGKITRNLAINRWEYHNAKKRGNGRISSVLEELHECIPSTDNVEQIVDEMHFQKVCNQFLETLSKEKRIIFMRRYWYLSSIRDIALDVHMSESRVKMILFRLRKDFRKSLEKEGICL